MFLSEMLSKKEGTYHCASYTRQWEEDRSLVSAYWLKLLSSFNFKLVRLVEKLSVWSVWQTVNNWN